MFCAGMSKTLIIISGPTGIGKSNLLWNWHLFYKTYLLFQLIAANYLNKWILERLSPPFKIKQKIKHYFIDHMSVNGTYNVGQYVNEASLVIDQEFESKQHVILCGGTGLYIKALIEGIIFLRLIQALNMKSMQFLMTRGFLHCKQNYCDLTLLIIIRLIWWIPEGWFALLVFQDR